MPSISAMLRACPRAATGNVAVNTPLLNMRTFADANGYIGTGGYTITVLPGIEATTVVRGTWPSGVKPTLINKGTLSGRGGNGGKGGTNVGPEAGGVGGTALDCTSGEISLDNTAGVIRGGGDGGDGGDRGIDPDTGYINGGGGGGGGQGNPGGFGGPAGGSSPVGELFANAGSNGSVASVGNGGAGDPSYGGGAVPGSTGGNGKAWGVGSGHAITGGSNITWSGGTPVNVVGAIAA